MISDSRYFVLITGASGFLGAHVTAACQNRGIPVVAAVRACSDLRRLQVLAPNVDMIQLDVTSSLEVLRDQLRTVRPSAVIHCASYGVDYRQSDFDSAVQVNLVGTWRLLCAAAEVGVSRFVHVGTAYEYGFADEEVDEDRRLQPSGVYGVTKGAATLAVLDGGIRLGVPVVVVRPFGMYGPLEGRHKLVPMVMRAGLTMTPIELSPGWQRRDYAYVGDVSAACVELAVRHDFPAGQIFNLCSGKGLFLRTLAAAALDAIGGNPDVLRWGAKPYRTGEVMYLVGDNRLAERCLHWRPTTSLVSGMAMTAEFERQRVALGVE